MTKEPLISVDCFNSSIEENQQQCIDAMNYLAGTIEHRHPDLFERLVSLQSEITEKLGLA